MKEWLTAKQKQTMTEPLTTFLDRLTLSSPSLEEKEKLLATLLEQEGINGDVCVLINSLLDTNQYPLIERFLRCLASFKHPHVDRIVSSSSYLSMLEKMASIQKSNSMIKLVLELHLAADIMILSSSYQSILHATASFLANDDIGISDISFKILNNLIDGFSGMEDYFINLERIIETIMKASEKFKTNYTIYLRYMILVSRVIGMGESEFELCLRLGAVQGLMDTIYCPDILVQVLSLILFDI